MHQNISTFALALRPISVPCPTLIVRQLTSKRWSYSHRTTVGYPKLVITMDSGEINRLLLSRFQEVCQNLLPNGKVQGNHYLVGGLDGGAGTSLQITLSGAAAGRYIDF